MTGKAIKDKSKQAGEVLKDKTVVASKTILKTAKKKAPERAQLTQQEQTGQLTQQEGTVQLTETKLDRDFVFVKQRRYSDSILSGVVSAGKLPEKCYPVEQRIRVGVTGSGDRDGVPGSGDRRSLSRIQIDRVEKVFERSANRLKKRARSAGTTMPYLSRLYCAKL